MKYLCNKQTLLLFCCFIMAGATFAQEAAKEAEAPKLSISGAVDAYYQYNFNKNPAPTSFTPAHNSFSLGMAQVILSKESGKVGFTADLAFGPRAEAGNYGYYGSSFTDQLIKQLFVTYKPISKLKLTLGTFGTFVGYELIDATGNINYSTSYLFSYGPFYHTGLKAEFALSDHFTLMGGVFNDTDSKFDFNGKKHIGGQLAYVNGDFKAYLNYLNGLQGTDSTGFTVNQLDLVASYQLGKLGLGLNVTDQLRKFGEADPISWMGAAVYANYAVSDKLVLAVRGEALSDKDHAILGEGEDGTQIMEVTCSANIKIAGGLTLIPEFRLDHSTSSLYTGKDGDAKTSTAGFLLAAVYKF